MLTRLSTALVYVLLVSGTIAAARPSPEVSIKYQISSYWPHGAIYTGACPLGTRPWRSRWSRPPWCGVILEPPCACHRHWLQGLFYYTRQLRALKCSWLMKLIMLIYYIRTFSSSLQSGFVIALLKLCYKPLLFRLRSFWLWCIDVSLIPVHRTRHDIQNLRILTPAIRNLGNRTYLRRSLANYTSLHIRGSTW
jgi:hypothetical protein